MKLKMMLKKKAIFYLFTVIVFLGVMLLVLYTYQSYSLRDKQGAIDTRIRTMNDFINDFNTDVERSTRISATRAMIALEDYVSTNERFFDNITHFEETFREVFYYGSIGGINHSLMEDSSFQVYEQKVFANAKNIGIGFYINVTRIQLQQDDPWYVKVIIDATIKLNDTSRLAYWDYNDSFTTKVPIDGLRDPLYGINTLGRLQNAIRPTNITNFVIENNTDGLIEHIADGFYIANSDAPSFVMRFYNDLSSSPYGIESIVDIQTVSDQGLELYTDRPVIDYKYFSGAYIADVCNVYNMPLWFKIESSDLLTYNLTVLNYTIC